MKRGTEAIVVAVVAAVLMVCVVTLLVMAANQALGLDDAPDKAEGDVTVVSKEISDWFDSDKWLLKWGAWLEKLEGKSKKRRADADQAEQDQANTDTSANTDTTRTEPASVEPLQGSTHTSIRDNEELINLPNIDSRGNVRSLRQVMRDDSSGKLKNLIKQFVKEQDATVRAALLDRIIFAWTGAEKYAKDSRGPYIDGRIVYALEAYFADEFLQNGVLKNPSSNAAIKVKESYRIVKDRVNATLLGQTHLRSYMLLVDEGYGQGRRIRKDPSKAFEVSSLMRALRLSYIEDKEKAVQLAKEIRYTIWYGDMYKDTRKSILKEIRDEISVTPDSALIGFKKTMFAVFKGDE